MGIFSHFSGVSRRRKLELFQENMRPTMQDKVLDVGAEVGRTSTDVQFIDWYPWKENITGANISQDRVDAICKRHPMVHVEVADARRLPWPDKHFDIVYSNAVIEHVGGRADQEQMASEIMRVGKRWFVTTPNRWYPFEFHMRLPFVTWLPRHGYLAFSRIVRYSYSERKYVFGSRYGATLRLMGARNLRRCFPGSRIIRQRVTFMPETLIAVGPVA